MSIALCGFPCDLAAYEAVRSDPALFVVAAGHNRPEIEAVVRRSGAYQVVKKKGEAARIAIADDPRE
jgi:hypothetical protein